jgi:hypothetical protein
VSEQGAILSEKWIKDITERTHLGSYKDWSAYLSRTDVLNLLASHAALTERLAEAERERDSAKGLEGAGVKMMESQMATIANQLTAANERYNALKPHLSAAEQERKDLRDQLAVAQATIAGLREMAERFVTQDGDLATERERRIASEGRERELRKALEILANEDDYHEVGLDDSGVIYWFWNKTVIDEPWDIARKALATPASDRVGKVLAAAEARVAALDALCEALLDDSEERPTSKYRAAMAASLAAEEMENKVVRAYREGIADET